jgi:nucleotide-binding universal stress UspA family protein
VDVLTVLPTDLELYGGPWAVGLGVFPTEDLKTGLRAERTGLLERAGARLARAGLDVATRMVEGRAASVIVEVARTHAADLIIMGARGHGAVERVLLGSVSAEVVEQAGRAVLVARRPTAGRLLVGTDGSDAATSAIGFVGSSGLFVGAEARVIDVLDIHPAWWSGVTPGDAATAVDAYVTVAEAGRSRAEEVTAAAVARLGSAGLDASAIIHSGRAAAAICDEARSWHADLVVVGNRGHGLMQRLLMGSTARSVLHHTDVSALITRPGATVAAYGSVAAEAPADPVPA